MTSPCSGIFLNDSIHSGVGHSARCSEASPDSGSGYLMCSPHDDRAAAGGVWRRLPAAAVDDLQRRLGDSPALLHGAVCLRELLQKSGQTQVAHAYAGCRSWRQWDRRQRSQAGAAVCTGCG
eukprot:jgi/Ulvmu1/12652/UM094_0008.1